MNNNYLEHHGILGQKWGVRRYQNEDGSYTDAGARRHAIDEAKGERKAIKKQLRKSEKEYNRARRKFAITRQQRHDKYAAVSKAKNQLQKDHSAKINNDLALVKAKARNEKQAVRAEKQVYSKAMRDSKNIFNVRNFEQNSKQIERNNVEKIMKKNGKDANYAKKVKMRAVGEQASQAVIAEIGSKGLQTLIKASPAIIAAGTAYVKSSKARAAMPRLTQNKKFNPIDTNFKILN